MFDKYSKVARNLELKLFTRFHEFNYLRIWSAECWSLSIGENCDILVSFALKRIELISEVANNFCLRKESTLDFSEVCTAAAVYCS